MKQKKETVDTEKKIGNSKSKECKTRSDKK